MMRKILTVLISTLTISAAQANETLDRAIIENEAFRASGNVKTELYSVEEILPTDLAPGSSEEVIAEKIAFKSADSLIKKVKIKNKTAEMVAKSVSSGMAIKADFEISEGNGQSPDHKFSLNAAIAKTEATLSYTGYIAAQLKYSMSNNETSINISESLGENSNLHITQSLAEEASATNVSFSLTY